MKKIFYLSALGALLFASCAKIDNPNPNEGKTFSFEIGAEKETGDTDETRVELIDGLMHWSVGDQVKMFIKQTGSTLSPMDNILEGIPMTGLHSEPVRATTFAGKLTQTTISKLNPNSRYDYITTYCGGSNSNSEVTVQYVSGNNSTTTEISYRVGAGSGNGGIVNVPKNEFSKTNVLMFAAARNLPPATYLENGKQKFGERMTFTYKHVLGYMRLRIDKTDKPIKQIQLRVTGTADTNQKGLVGNLRLVYYWSYNTYSTVGNFTGVSSSMRMNFNGSEQVNTGDYLYIPIVPKTFGSTVTGFEFQFTFDDNTTSGWKNVNLIGKRIEAGKIYDIAFNL